MRSTGTAINRRTSCKQSRQTYNATIWGIPFVVVSLLLGGCQSTEETQTEPPQTLDIQAAQETKPTEPPAAETGEPVSLFDGRTLGQWKPTDFGGQGDVYVKDGAIYMNMGNYMTGITWSGPVVRMNYEITLEAMRVEGNDFFCGLTFPVADKPCTLVLGGWGGGVCGLSTIDYYDASENQTTRFMNFEKGRWYFVRLRVVPDRIQAWLDGEELVNFETADHKIGIRVEVDSSQPLGIATWMTTGAVRNIKVKPLPEQTE